MGRIALGDENNDGQRDVRIANDKGLGNGRNVRSSRNKRGAGKLADRTIGGMVFDIVVGAMCLVNRRDDQHADEKQTRQKTG